MDISKCQQPRRSWLLLSGFALVFIAASFLLSWPTAEQEPRWGGHRLSQWLWKLQTSFEPGEGKAKAEHAIREMGTDCIPWLLRELDRTNASTFEQLEHEWERRISLSVDDSIVVERRFRAFQCFEVLGPMAKPAIPELVRRLERQQTNKIVALSLAAIAKPALPSLLSFATNSAAPNQLAAVSVIGRLKEAGAEAAPFLRPLVTDTDARLRRGALRSLTDVTQNKHEVIPLIANAVRDPDRDVHESAFSLLVGLGPVALEARDTLLWAATNSASRVPNSATKFLRQLEPGISLPNPP